MMDLRKPLTLLIWFQMGEKIEFEAKKSDSGWTQMDGLSI
jgi:hypothetical protein